ncbi:hydrolase [Spirochaetia bacterium]|nr:hydrolase [Spirochaetia bacterium]
MVTIKEWKRPATSGEGQILSKLWAEDTPVAVVQLVHGMAEYVARYDEFARFLAENGFAVCGNDHAGHGRGALVKGYFAEKDGWQHLLNDMKYLNDEVCALYPGLPVFLFGHSMGSFLARSYITRWPGLSGCILSGTMGKNPLLPVGLFLSSVQKKILGAKSQAKLICFLSMCQNNKRIKNPVNIHAWVSTVDQAAIDYRNDPDCGFYFTAGGMYDMFSGIKEISAPAWAKKVPKDLPVYLFAGAEDPVGSYGAGPRLVYARLQAAGVKDVQLKLYKGARHECLREFNKTEVSADTLGWLLKHI